MSSFDSSCIDVQDFLECLDIQNIHEASTQEIGFSCPFPNHANGDQNPSAFMRKDTSVYYCHGCHSRGTAVHFAADLLDITELEAIRLLKQRYSPAGINPDSVDVVEQVNKILQIKYPKIEENEIIDESVLKKYSFNFGKHPEHRANRYMLRERNFSLNSIQKWEIGYDYPKQRITIPIRDEDGCLVGIKGRKVYPDAAGPKYIYYGKNEIGYNPPQKSLILFGLNKYKTDIFGMYPATMILVEGELDVIAMHEMGFTNTVAINGSNLSDKQASLIKNNCDAVILFMDSDIAGQEASKNIYEKLNKFVSIKIVRQHYDDPSEMTFATVTDLLAFASHGSMLKLNRQYPFDD